MIKLGRHYQDAFIKGKVDDYTLKDLVFLMMHEMVHLRLAHHRKSFYAKLKEATDKFKIEELDELFEGLRKEQA